jgi:hypothetical protein
MAHLTYTKTRRSGGLSRGGDRLRRSSMVPRSGGAITTIAGRDTRTRDAPARGPEMRPGHARSGIHRPAGLGAAAARVSLGHASQSVGQAGLELTASPCRPRWCGAATCGTVTGTWPWRIGWLFRRLPPSPATASARRIPRRAQAWCAARSDGADGPRDLRLGPGVILQRGGVRRDIRDRHERRPQRTGEDIDGDTRRMGAAQVQERKGKTCRYDWVTS